VLPITHTAPADQNSAVEIPSPVKHHLGLDEDRSWVVVAEGNEFLWPGFDLRRRSDSERYEYGFIPPRLFRRILEAFVLGHQSGRNRVAPRD
jgi:hypothetical protein